ncbi:formyltransferase [Candidatus Pandoraea novymonadis]|uniref:Bifunctional polymyxin resistance protein ArnA n=1 Tax=Candidatus Pandoraea novymonadis TaxID=1808959 RepID=A0ABX5FEC3_9BURK|nr:formyltransferase [Candidatus Pandoraea novymonadis]PSB92064.1 Bifunctional polymyxin resistance protein ArnA [Candidatus Pandoraea novymonadis]
MKSKVVVFAYHNVGVRCLRVLLTQGVDVALVISHQNSPNENIWFDSVASVAAEHHIPVVTPNHANGPDLQEKITAIAPDFIFSFYYRHIIPSAILSLAKHGAFNMHGSLLPKYRGRAPVNWAVLRGESETGATLHEMIAQPDAGAIVEQTTVPILPDDTAGEVFEKVTVAAEQTLWHCLPKLLNGTAPRRSNDLRAGSYFGVRKPEDGKIDWRQSAINVYNLIRAVSFPYPGAFTNIRGNQWVVSKARLSHIGALTGLHNGLQVVNHQMLGICGDGHAIDIQELLLNGVPVTPERFSQLNQ